MLTGHVTFRGSPAEVTSVNTLANSFAINTGMRGKNAIRQWHRSRTTLR
jgi:hypothetical protein